MNKLSQKQILLLAPNLIGESLALKLNTQTEAFNTQLSENDLYRKPSLIIWNIFNINSLEILRLEIHNLKERWKPIPVLILVSGESKFTYNDLLSLNCEGLLIDPSVDKLIKSIETIEKGGRVFESNSNELNSSTITRRFSISQRILLQGLKQIDYQINNLSILKSNKNLNAINNFILKGRIRELSTAKTLLVFIWGSPTIEPSELIKNNSSITKELNSYQKSTIFLDQTDSLKTWAIINKNLLDKFIIKDVLLSPDLLALSSLQEKHLNKLFKALIKQLDDLILNLSSESSENNDFQYKDKWESFHKELLNETVRNMSESYTRLYKDGESVSLTDEVSRIADFLEPDYEMISEFCFLDPIIKNKPIHKDGKYIAIYESEAFFYLEKIISNWIIRKSNIIASEFLNISSDWPEFRKYMFKDCYYSTRNFERFRNNLNNINRLNKYIYLPIQLYESKRELFNIKEGEIIKSYLSENRESDIKNLEWIQQQVTLLVEIKDALAPQVQMAVKYIGNLIVLLLTKILGRAIGLVGKGIAQGMGRTLSK